MRTRAFLSALALSSLAGLTLPTLASAQAPQLLDSWSTPYAPLGLAIGPDGLLYVGEPSGSASGVRIFSQNGAAHGLFKAGPEVHGLGALSSGFMLVAEYWEQFIGVYELSGVLASDLVFPGQYMLFISVDDQNRVYFTDDRNGQVELVRNIGNGQVVKQWAMPQPAGVCFLNGIVYVAGGASGTINAFMPDGTPVGSFPTGATSAQQLGADAAGNLLLADHGQHQLKCFRTDGTLLWTLGPSVPGYSYGICDFMSVTVGVGGVIFAGDATNRRILRLISLATPARTSSWGRIKSAYR